MHHITRVLCSITVVILLIGCAPASIPNGPHSGFFVGYYTWGFETSSFQPCGLDERWWLVGDAELLRRVDGGPPVYLEIHGDLSGIGQYGHRNAYRRELVMREISFWAPTPYPGCP